MLSLRLVVAVSVAVVEVARDCLGSNLEGLEIVMVVADKSAVNFCPAILFTVLSV